MRMSFLKKYRRRMYQLKAVEEELRHYLVVDVVEGCKGAPSFEKTAKLVEGYPHTERVLELLSQKHSLEEQQQMTEDFIFGIDDERVCEALILYCMDERLYNKIAEQKGKPACCGIPVRVTWSDVAGEMGEPSGSTIRMAVNRCIGQEKQQN